MYVDICKVWMGRKCQKPVVSLLVSQDIEGGRPRFAGSPALLQEPDINVDFTANRSKNPMRALMFWKNTAQTGYAWFAARLCAGYVTYMSTCQTRREGNEGEGAAEGTAGPAA